VFAEKPAARKRRRLFVFLDISTSLLKSPAILGRTFK